MTMKGGMTQNAFGGRKRIDQLDLMQYRNPDTTPEQLIYLNVIQDAANQYSIFGLGRNGASVDNFIESYIYFFVADSRKPETWNPDRTVYDVVRNEEGESFIPRQLTDHEMILGCFDIHLTLSGSERLMSLDQWRQRLKELRRQTLVKSWPQVKSYIAFVRKHDYNKLPEGTDLALNLDGITDEELLELLVEPKDLRRLANILYHGTVKPKRKYVPHKPRPIRVPSPRVPVLPIPEFEGINTTI